MRRYVCVGLLKSYGITRGWDTPLSLDYLVKYARQRFLVRTGSDSVLGSGMMERERERERMSIQDYMACIYVPKSQCVGKHTLVT